MNKVLRVVVVLPGILFMVTGLRFAIDPATAVAQFGMPLLDGAGRSTQLGDMTAFFLSLGIFILAGSITQKRSWFYPPVILIGLAAIFRVLAWLLHDAALSMNQIGPEIIITCLLLFAASRLPEQD